MDINILKTTAQALVAPKKGILAADESAKTIQKRFDKIGITSTPETNLVYRKMLFSTSGVEECISGVILFDETIKQEIDGVSVPKYLENKGILPGIKVDKGAWKIPASTSASLGGPNFENPARNASASVAGGEKMTEGLDGLRDRLTEYKNLGAKFAKWRAVITIGESIPTDACILANAHSLALYAALCQEADLVPIVEPEVLMDGGHDLSKCQEVTAQVLKTVYEQLKLYKVELSGTLLKPNMVISGKDCPIQASAEEIAKATIDTFNKVVPKEVPGIVFLSGGQTPDQATENLAAINSIGGPWQLSFSYGRALQEETLQSWVGKEENIKLAQKAFLARCQKVSQARSSN